MTIGELYDAAERYGFKFSFLTTGGLCVATPAIGADPELTRGICLLHKMISLRWREFCGFAELKLLAAGVEQPEWEPPR